MIRTICLNRTLPYLRGKPLIVTSETHPNKKIIKMAEFVLRNNSFEINNKVFRDIPRTTADPKFARSCIFIYMDRFE